MPIICGFHFVNYVASVLVFSCILDRNRFNYFCVIFFKLPISLLIKVFVFVFIIEDEPGKQVRSAIKIKNTSKSHVAFKVKGIRVYRVLSCLFSPSL